jgi:N-acetylglutamate synthase-like GNAT family acetyltransferase
VRHNRQRRSLRKRYSGAVTSWIVTQRTAPQQVSFRAATEADVDAIVALVESAYRGEASRAGWTTEADLLDGQRTEAQAVRAIITQAASRVLLGVAADGTLLACCQLERRDNGVCYFGMFAVSPVLQGGGIGRGMLAESERIATQEWDARTMEMTVISQRLDLIAWYERRGYRRTGQTRPFPHGDERFGLPRRDDLHFDVLAKSLS